MPVFYSPEWVAAFNAAVADLEVAEGGGPSLAAADGQFRVEQVVHDGPSGADLRVVLALADGQLAMERPEPGAEVGPVNVTLSLSYADAAALSRGEVEPAALVATGRVRVRGDLAVLVAAQALLATAAAHLAELRAATTY
ncbi:MAG TPA: SCP2 sterol-binding domain-containing protein [Acidimicrobiales bacterium]|nr:SCP2 sterol-binding domain-containing protein [Acidimicrobiales bacterium]